MMNNVQNSAISPGIRRIFFLSALLFILSAPACTAGDTKKKDVAARVNPVKEDGSLQEQLRNSTGFDTAPLRKNVDSLVVYKSKRLMYAYHKEQKLKVYVISLGQAPTGKKQCKGDNKTPEGRYYINDRNPASAYHKNLGISYPNDIDRANARRQGLSTGGDIKIHGLPVQARYPQEAYLYSDWTWGCIAVSNAEIDELYRFVERQAVIQILP